MLCPWDGWASSSGWTAGHAAVAPKLLGPQIKVAFLGTPLMAAVKMFFECGHSFSGKGIGKKMMKY